MSEDIDMSAVYARQEREAAFAAYAEAPGYPALVAEADRRGFRKAGLSEINASAEKANWAPDLYCWRGGLWIPKGGAA